jgi:hypothetical protein
MTMRRDIWDLPGIATALAARCFVGPLPPVRCVWASGAPAEQPDWVAWYRHSTRTIHVVCRPALDRRVLKVILVHELAHWWLACWGPGLAAAHGPVFTAMLRSAADRVRPTAPEFADDLDAEAARREQEREGEKKREETNAHLFTTRSRL